MNLPIAAFSIHSSEKAFKVQLLQQATQCGSSTVTMVEKIWFSQLNRTVSYLRHSLSLSHVDSLPNVWNSLAREHCSTAWELQRS